MRTDDLPRLARRLTAGSAPRLTTQLRVELEGITADQGEALATIARAHRLGPWLTAAVRNDPTLAELPQFAPLRAVAAMQTLGALGLYGELSRLLTKLNARDIPVIVLKGPHIANAYYPEPGLRPYGDLDILIRESDLAAVSELLEADGFEDVVEEGPHRLHQCHGLFQRIYKRVEPSACVEVHYDHLQIGLEPMTLDDAWERAAPMQFGRGHARVLMPDDLFVQLCVHLHRHGFNRLIWFKDLDLIVRQGVIDWARVAELARAEGCESSVGYALSLLGRLLGTPLPAGALGIVNQLPRVERLLFEAAWPSAGVISLTPSRAQRWRRAVQFAPETGLVRGGLASLPFVGRRRDKLRVLRSAIKQAAFGHG